MLHLHRVGYKSRFDGYAGSGGCSLDELPDTFRRMLSAIGHPASRDSDRVRAVASACFGDITARIGSRTRWTTLNSAKTKV